jgi:hypothetical protein
MGTYETIELTHRDAITQMRFHTDGGILRWGPTAYEDAYHAFTEVGDERATRGATSSTRPASAPPGAARGSTSGGKAG